MAPRFVNNRYALSGKPIEGGMSVVYKASDAEANHRMVAVKCFQGGRLENEIQKRSFERESRALQELRHQNIVELLDWGRDQDTGDYFIVLPWIDGRLDLEPSLQNLGWDDFSEAVALPVLRGLALAHSRDIIHRDVKPSNVLIDALGVPKLADFGISKLKKYLHFGQTLRDFGSPLYCPPEADDGLHSFTRDVYAFGAMTLTCMVDQELIEPGDLRVALADFDAPFEVVELITRCVSPVPEERPRDAMALLSDLERIQAKRSSGYTMRPTIPLEIPRGRVTAICEGMGVDSETELRAAIEEDLRQNCAIQRYGQDPDHYVLLGTELSIHVALDRVARDRFILFNCRTEDDARLERRRESAMPVDASLRFVTRYDHNESRTTLDQVQDAFSTFEVEQRMASAERMALRVLDSWSNILKAETELENQRFARIEYVGVRVSGERAIFSVDEMIQDGVVGTEWVVKVDENTQIGGEIESISNGEVSLWLKKGRADRLPIRGCLIFDSWAARRAISRQQEALDSIRYGTSAKGNALQVLLDPLGVGISDLNVRVTPKQDGLDDAKLAAVELALSCEDVLLVTGPPGTGKTTFISELILQELETRPESKILLSSQTHVALDNALEKVTKLSPETKAIRVGRPGDSRISESSACYLLQRQIERWRQEVVKRSAEGLEQWAMSNGMSLPDVRFGAALRRYVAALQDRERLEELATQVRGDRFVYGSPTNQDEVSDEVALIENQMTLKRSECEDAESLLVTLDPVLGKELVGLPPQELTSWADSLMHGTRGDQLAKTMDLLGEWQVRLASDGSLVEPLLDETQLLTGTCVGLPSLKSFNHQTYDLCIVDEASKAKATEALVPMARAKRWVLVGDSNQLPPLTDELCSSGDLLSRFDLTPDEVRETLFARLERELPPRAKCLLNKQYRMVGPIGSLISRCFYEGKLLNGSVTSPLPLIEKLPSPVTWISTSALAKRQELRSGTSYSNPLEATLTRNVLVQLNSEALTSGIRLRVGVVSGYATQIAHIRNRIAVHSQEWPALHLECNTIDAFQGREVDVAIYSVTRSNQNSRVGFLGSAERLNVALSRGRYLLVILGDHAFCSNLAVSSKLRDVARYIQNESECALRMAEEWL